MRRRRNCKFSLYAAALLVSSASISSRGEDISQPPILQIFDSSWSNDENRAADIFIAGYGGLWTPPPSRADSGNTSVGYDLYDRFDLGKPNNSTQYGTETGLKTTVATVHRFGGAVYSDLILNHNGFRDNATSGFVAQGGYPGFVMTQGADTDGDFHSASASGDIQGRISGLIDIAQEKNYVYVRNPVPGNASNLPAGTIANIPDSNNKRFYPDQALTGITAFDPKSGQNVTIYPFNNATPLSGDPVAETNLQYLTRHAQWMVETIGVDGFRLDAAKHYLPSVLDALDVNLYKSIKTPLLNGQQKNTLCFSEVYDGNKLLLQSYIRKDISTVPANTVGGNRDALDFPLYFAMVSNLNSGSTSSSNNWNNVINASQDSQDDGFANNGSQGVAFVQSHDASGAPPGLINVAYAYSLMRPGNAVVYFNAHEFGARSFPTEGKTDALGGFYGNALTTLINIRNTHSHGNYTPRLTESRVLAYERQGSAIVLLSNYTESGFDSRTIATSFAPGTKLLELTGNAANPTLNPFGDFAQVVTVKPDGSIDVKIPRNTPPGSSTLSGKGYLVYGLATPTGSLSISGASGSLAGGTQTASNYGTTRIASIDVITAGSFSINLQTTPVSLPGGLTDSDANGDRAYVKLDAGLDINGSGTVDFVSPGTDRYGFENFLTKSSPLVGGGDGQFIQNINAAQLSEGMHFVEVKAFRKQTGSNQEVFSDFRKAIYVDRLKPNSGVDSVNGSSGSTREVRIKSLDQTGNSVHLFLNLPAATTDAQIIASLNSGNHANMIDRDLFSLNFSNVPNGNNVITAVTFEMTGNVNVQRFPGIAITTTRGSGLGDVNFDNSRTTSDVLTFENVLNNNILNNQNGSFNAASDLSGDGRVDDTDLFALPALYKSFGATAAANEARNAVVRRGNLNGDGVTNAADIDRLYLNLGSTSWIYDIDSQYNAAN